LQRRDGFGPIVALRFPRRQLIRGWPVAPGGLERRDARLELGSSSYGPRALQLGHGPEPHAQLFRLAAAHQDRIEPRRDLGDIRGRADAPERRRVRRRVRARVAEIPEPGLAGQHREQRPVVLSKMDADAGVGRPQAERALGAQQPVQIRHERVAVRRSRGCLIRCWCAKGPDRRETVVEPAQCEAAIRDPGRCDPHRGPPRLIFAALAAAQLVLIE
jgi:hypothetical protein